ncbi:hypothetical protein NZD89_00205 [Alicyclobacillus fastidiosus]|uniref:MFS transporter n=1 Tax=Alicyclobacillus fastidiosus TaxID=392011 RepID=A0ABY6ZJA6_9BACL|nr:hypothetical protein [Alicyclobacillus fastidiosus]WAH41990.1 hypothetical protein NZD89_00205 [Alicyclobacillus fastidiosus]
MRGTYFGVSSIGGLSFFVGPWLGGVILHASSGTVLFLVAAGFSFLATPMYRTADKIRLSRQSKCQQETTLSAFLVRPDVHKAKRVGQISNIPSTLGRAMKCHFVDMKRLS